MGPEIPGWPDRACSPWRHVMCKRNQIVRMLLGDCGSKARRLNMTQTFHVISSVGMVQCICFQKRDNTSGALGFKLDWLTTYLTGPWMLPKWTHHYWLLGVLSPPMFLGLIYLLSDSLCFKCLNSFNLMKIKICRSEILWSECLCPPQIQRWSCHERA